jgi:hypothetical protein
MKRRYRSPAIGAGTVILASLAGVAALAIAVARQRQSFSDLVASGPPGVPTILQPAPVPGWLAAMATPGTESFQ